MIPIPRNPSLSFRDQDGRCWGYQLPHLLAMHFQKAGNPHIELDMIRLWFSNESVTVQGVGLEHLWQHLVDGTPTEALDKHTRSYSVKLIRILPHADS